MKYLFTDALKLKRNDRIIKLNWIETKVSYVCKVQMQTSSWLMQRPLAECKCHIVESYIQLLS